MSADRKLKNKYYNKKTNAKKENIPFDLTFEQFSQLALAAGITHTDMHINGYHLARYNDSGGYSFDNCRFVPKMVNIKEKKLSPKNKEACTKRIIEYNKSLTYNERSCLARKAAETRRRKGTQVSPNILSEEVINSRLAAIRHVDFTVYGWVSKVAKVLGISHTHARRFVARYMDIETYKRKQTTYLSVA